MAWTSSACPQGDIVSSAGNPARLQFDIGVLLPATRWKIADMRKAVAAAHLSALVLLLLPIDAGPLLAVLMITGAGVAVLTFLQGDEDAAETSGRADRSEASRPIVAGEPAFDLDALPAGYTAVLSALKSSKIDIKPDCSTAAASPHKIDADQVRVRLEAEQRFKASAELMARVSHEIRTPLNAVIGFSDLMSAETFGPVGHPRYREYADHIRDSGRMLLKSAEDTLALTSLLASARSEGSNGLAFDVTWLAHNAWSFFADEAANRNVCLDVRAAAGTEVLGERGPLRQVLINLFNEALARVADNGTVVLYAATDGGLVHVEIAVEAGARPSNAIGNSLAVCLAQRLLELQGATLIEADGRAAGTWRAAMALDRAAQADLFARPTLRGD